MRKSKLLSMLFTFAAVFLFSSCNNDNEIPQDDAPENEVSEIKSKYTIMLYGAGGGDLDNNFELNIMQSFMAVNSDVNMTAQVKWSSTFESELTEVEKGCVYRFSLDSEKDITSISDKKIAGKDFQMYDPKNLADFINYSKETYPAENYILILWNHGRGYLPMDDAPKSRGVIYDDNLEGKCMSINEVVEGIKLSDTHFKAIYYDACLMAMMENWSELTECAEYAIGSAHSVPGVGGLYTSLIDNLTTESDFETAIGNFCEETMMFWEKIESDEAKLDISMTKLSEMANVNAVVKNITDRLITLYDDEEVKPVINLVMENSYNIENGLPFYDILYIADGLSLMTQDLELVRYYSQLYRAFDRAMVCHNQSKTLTEDGMFISLGVNLGHNGTLRVTTGDPALVYYKWDGTAVANLIPSGEKVDFEWSSTWTDTYEKLAFDKATGWSQWLKKNQQQPKIQGIPMP